MKARFYYYARQDIYITVTSLKKYAIILLLRQRHQVYPGKLFPGGEYHRIQKIRAHRHRAGVECSHQGGRRHGVGGIRANSDGYRRHAADQYE